MCANISDIGEVNCVVMYFLGVIALFFFKKFLNRFSIILKSLVILIEIN